jgi:hypothetical protein
MRVKQESEQTVLVNHAHRVNTVRVKWRRVPVHCVQQVGDPPAGAPNVKRATKENLVPRKAVIVKIVHQQRFKTQVKVHCAVIAQPDGTNPSRVHEHASV